MKTAIALYGMYNPIYKKNNYKGDLFFLTYEPFQDNAPVKSQIINSAVFQWVNEAQKMSYIDHYFITEAHKLINEHDKYDIIVFTTFDCIITAFPSLPGIYSTPCFIQPPFPKDIIPAYKILSHNAMRYNSIMVASISELSLEVRKDLYTRLFPDRV